MQLILISRNREGFQAIRMCDDSWMAGRYVDKGPLYDFGDIAWEAFCGGGRPAK
jgi:hypothetical protein